MIGWDKTAVAAGAAAFAALIACAPLAAAQPAAPPEPVPAPVPLPAPAPGPAPADAAPVQSLAAGPAAPVDAASPDGVPHLSSPENLPPGTTETPTTQTKLGYLRDLWHAMQTQEVTGSDALLLLTQRPMSAGPTPAMSPVAPPPAPAPADPAPVTP
ncbi:hypothetical protein BST22_25880 [Mycolicibacterium chubuense]|uniref:Uncharacterized protein n=1 Tax=Mycolicibacterium chubuense TaxID=1800 RepID=A0A0J6WMK1_MYCCU|nr:hypothetical protein [Mycolicibacterium chubuense]KMO83293.1 hypothetical protein MCHUDSM44219_01295 [Mycolicibacterium chubuense]ORA43930.1 hypothetical protein BST22_25880 [Mycolicibacterium chubuense]SPX96133.1 transglycosylase domain-containing protein [Mycolicibacterium chubuense]